MKKKVGDKVYLQKYDIGFITHELDEVPACIIDDLFGDRSVFYSAGPEDAVNFDHAFTGEAAYWIMAQKWLVDFDDHAKSTEKQVRELLDKEREQYDKDIAEFNAKDDDYKEKNFPTARVEFDKRGHYLKSLSLMSLYLGGQKQFYVPGVKKKRHLFKKT